MADSRLKNALKTGKLIQAPGVFDLISARIADKLGFQALYMTGYGVAASDLGVPDIGLATYNDMVERVYKITDRTDTPLIADADTGYGGLANVRHTVRGYEKAGVSALQIEDQIFPKRCGQLSGVQLVSTQAMVDKIKAALDTRRDENLLVIARTDARSSLGLESAIERAQAYADIGADVIFVEMAPSLDEIAFVRKQVSAPLLVNVVPHNASQLPSAEVLENLGVDIAIYPVDALFSAATALRNAYFALRPKTEKLRNAAPISFSDFNKIVGLEEEVKYFNVFEDTEGA